MCNGFCNELKRWLKAFTLIETLLCIVELILLVVLIGFLIFLILHLIACAKHVRHIEPPTTAHPPKPTFTSSAYSTTSSTTISSASVTGITGVTDSTKVTDSAGSTGDTKNSGDPRTDTFAPGLECSWEPSKPTSAVTHYYLGDTSRLEIIPATTQRAEILDKLAPSHDYDDVEFLEQSDGETAEDEYSGYVLALVKINPPAEVIYGCMLTKISYYWTLTAASCIEAIEEVDTLDNFFMLEGYGEARAGRSHAVTDVRLHPLYQGANRTYDLAALRSEDVLVHEEFSLRLPTMLDYFLIALGERFLLLGHGRYRSVDKNVGGRRLRQVWVFVSSPQQCGVGGAQGGGEAWAVRHLAGGAEAGHGACGAAALCAGSRWSRGTPCNYCGGTPLLRGALLLGLMSHNAQCGAACEPQLYVNLATLRDWIDSVVVD